MLAKRIIPCLDIDRGRVVKGVKFESIQDAGDPVEAQALAAVSLAFPVVMLLTALTTLAGGGMSSLLARHLGAGSRREAGAVFTGAPGLALAISAMLIVGALTVGPAILSVLAAGNSAVAELARYGRSSGDNLLRDSASAQRRKIGRRVHFPGIRAG